MISFTLQPLQPVGRVLCLTGQPLRVTSDACHVRRALVEVLDDRGMRVHTRSKSLASQVSSDRETPYAVVTTGKGLLLAVWRVV